MYPRSLLFFSSYPVLIFTSLVKSAPPPLGPFACLQGCVQPPQPPHAASQPEWDSPFLGLLPLTSLAFLVFIKPEDNIFRFHLEFPSQPLSKPLRKFRKEGHGNVRLFFSTELWLSKWSKDDVRRPHWEGFSRWWEILSSFISLAFASGKLTLFCLSNNHLR